MGHSRHERNTNEVLSIQLDGSRQKAIDQSRTVALRLISASLLRRQGMSPEGEQSSRERSVWSCSQCWPCFVRADTVGYCIN